MKQVYRNINHYLKNYDTWLFISVFIIFAAERAVNIEPHSWEKYIHCSLYLAIIYLPTLIFVQSKIWLKKRLRLWQYIVSWVAIFGIYAGFVSWASIDLFTSLLDVFGYEDYFIGVGIFLGFMDIVIELSRLIQGKKGILYWIERIGINRVIWIFITGLSTIMGMMVVSDLKTFYEMGVITNTLNLKEIFFHFPLFISYTLQFGFIFSSLYFFYLMNDKILIPILLKQRGIPIYLIGTAGIIALFFPILSQIIVSLPITQTVQEIMPQENLKVFTEQNATIPLIVIIFSLPFIVALQWFQQNQKITLLAQQQTESELNLLKQQINPHFFFNTLNNLYALSLEKSDQSPEVILRLSDLMRYVIYEGKKKDVFIEAEVNYLKDYIELQQIRLHKSFQFTFYEEIQDQSMKIPPLLLIILIENAFKHGVEPSERDCSLFIDIKNQADYLQFICKNSFETSISSGKGIGLENLKRRLELLFPNNHRLTTTITGHTFTANLEIWTM